MRWSWGVIRGERTPRVQRGRGWLSSPAKRGRYAFGRRTIPDTHRQPSPVAMLSGRAADKWAAIVALRKASGGDGSR